MWQTNKDAKLVSNAPMMSRRSASFPKPYSGKTRRMLRRAIIAALPLLAAAPALASGKKEESKPGEPKEAGQYVDLASVALPIVVNGQVLNYIFVSVRIVLTSSANPTKLRAKEPYFRDALVKAGSRTPFTNPKDYMTVDVPRLQAVMLREAVALSSAQDIKSVVVQSQTPKRRIAMPHSGGRSDDGEIHP